MKFQDVYKRLNGKEATTEDVLRFERLTATLETTPNDALLAVLVALDHYETLYGKIPASIKDAAQKAATSAAEQAQAEVNKAVAALIPSVEKAVADGARNAIVVQSVGKSAITLILASLIIGAVFATGVLYGARILDYAAKGHLTWGYFLSNIGWTIAAGAAVPGMLMLFAANFEEEKTWYQWLTLLFAVAILSGIVYTMLTV